MMKNTAWTRLTAAVQRLLTGRTAHEQAAEMPAAESVAEPEGTSYFLRSREERRASGALCAATTDDGELCNGPTLWLAGKVRAAHCRHHASWEELRAWVGARPKRRRPVCQGRSA
ncbi:hypothetical protein [Kineococcus glutinatus]|uniref:Uncharacterized protein n=1 Tax=Kineococcus glutinatus TaxID=1070872 RepID=A0ABP9HIR6_9ACTN